MASIHLEGVLLDSLGEIDVGGVLTFTQLSTTGETLATTRHDLIIPPDGAYSIDVEYGRIRLDYATEHTKRLIGVVIVDSNSTATTIPELLNAAVPIKDDSLLEMESLLGDTIDAKNDAEAAADRAEAAADGIQEIEETFPAMTLADFEARAKQNAGDAAGSGFAEWGKELYQSGAEAINSGLSSYPTNSPDALLIGAGYNSTNPNIKGVSRSNAPILNINGVTQVIDVLNMNSSTFAGKFSFPPAPNGSKTYDGTTGTIVQHASSAAAFASETATNKVIITRQDLVVIESWHEKISDKDVVYPLGNVQYGNSSWNGIGLSNTLIAQSYSAYGEWDTDTKGYGVTWSTLSLEQKAAFLSDPENNIFSDDGELIQVRYRARVIEGLGDDWGCVDPQINDSYLGYGTGGQIYPRGSLVVCDDYYSGKVYINNYPTFPTTDDLPDDKVGLWSMRGVSTNNNKAYKGRCYAMPVALVERRNQGAFDPVLNPCGTGRFWNDTGASNSQFWYGSSAKKPATTAQCFESSGFNAAGNVSPFTSFVWGSIVGGENNGRSDGQAYDAIYASDVNDLRMSSKRLPLDTIREKYKRDAINAEVRGFEAVPYTYTFDASAGGSSQLVPERAIIYSNVNVNPFGSFCEDKFEAVISGYLVDNSDNNNMRKVIRATYTSSNSSLTLVLDGTDPWTASSMFIGGFAQNYKQAKPTWVDIVGTPTRIAATFPDGVQGQWVPVIPDGTLKDYVANKKFVVDYDRQYTNNNGSSWGNALWQHSDISENVMCQYAEAESRVMLYNYQSQADFTTNDINSTVLDLGGAQAGNMYYVNRGCILQQSLTAAIGTGSSQVEAGSVWDHRLLPNNLGGVLATTSNYATHHDTILGGSHLGYKTLDYLSTVNGVAKLCYVYKEVIWDGNSWGDDSKFQIIDNQSTMLDDNGLPVKYGTASFKTQYFTVSSELPTATATATEAPE